MLLLIVTLLLSAASKMVVEAILINYGICSIKTEQPEKHILYNALSIHCNNWFSYSSIMMVNISFKSSTYANS